MSLLCLQRRAFSFCLVVCSVSDLIGVPALRTDLLLCTASAVTAAVPLAGSLVAFKFQCTRLLIVFLQLQVHVRDTSDNG